MDALRLESAEFSKLVCTVHALTYRYTPKLYGKGYVFFRVTNDLTLLWFF